MARVKKPVWSGDWPIPKTINLPGVRVRVKIMPSKDVEQTGGTDYGFWTYAGASAETPDAVIYLSDKWPIEIQRYVLLHELQHALIESLDQMIEKFPEHVQTHTMRKLIELKKEELGEKGNGSPTK